jgi:hypothetical protein
MKNVLVREASNRTGGGAARDVLLALAIAGVGVGLRLAFVAAYPSRPFSDFLALVDFGFRLRDHGLTAPGWHWAQFNPGLPMILSVLLRFASPTGGFELVRSATAVATGLVGLAPFLLWRGVVAFRTRLLAGAMFALWPGQVFFSGVVAQDNWVLLPAVALASLAVRRLRSAGTGYPFWAGLLYAAAAAIRQDMLLVLLPVLLAAAFGPRRAGRMRRQAAALLLSAGLPLLLLARQRQLATGRFTLTTEHGGLAILGSSLPGAFEPGWIDPRPYVERIDPAMAADRQSYFSGAWSLARREMLRRPDFHALRIAAQTMRVTLKADGLDLFWSLRMPEALPAGLQAKGEEFAQAATPWLDVEMAAILGLFSAAMLAAFWRKDAAILLVGLCAILKVLLQALLSPMPRLLVPATAMELLAISLGFALAADLPKRRGALLAVAVAVPALFAILLPPLSRAVERMDREEIERRARSFAAVAPSTPTSPGGREGGRGGRNFFVL